MVHGREGGFNAEATTMKVDKKRKFMMWVGGFGDERPIPLTSVLIFRSTEYTTAIDFWFAGCVVAELLLRQCQEQSMELKKTQMKVDVKDIGDKWNQLPEEEKNKYIQMGKLQSEQYAQLKTVVQQKPPEVKIQTRIELTSICKIIRRLDKAQQQAVSDMGFHGILSLRCTHIDHDLCHWLVQNFDPSTHSLNVHGLRMLLTIEDVHELMGLPSNGLPVKLTESVDEITNLCDELAVKNKFVPFTSLKSYLLETKDAGTEFKRKFVLYIIGALLCPTTKAGVHQSFIKMVKNIESISQFNWAKHTLDFLVNRIAIAKVKERSATCGCLLLLMLFCLKQFARKRELVATSNSIPRLSYWGNSEIKQGLNQIKALGGYLNVEVALPNIVEKSNAVTLSQGRIDKNDDSRLAKVEKQVIEIHALSIQGHKDTRQDEDEKRLTKVENQVEKILELLEKHMPVDGEQVKTPPSKLLAEQRLVKMENQVGQILELLQRRIPVDGGHVKTPPSKLHEEHRIDNEMVGLDDSCIEKVAANSPKFVDEDEIRNMNDKKPMETLHLRKTKPILTPPNAKAVAKKRAKLVGGKALNNEQLFIPQKGRLRAKKSDTKAVEMNAVTMSSSCSVVRGPQTRGTQNCKASQWLRTPFVKFDIKKKRPQLKPSSTDNNVDNNIHDNLDELFDNLLDQLGGNVVPEIPKSSVPLPDPLNDYDRLVLRYAFDESLSEGEYFVRMKLHYVEAQSATRKELWSLKPYQWISSCIINLIFVKLTNKQRKKFPNKDHKQKILCQPSDDTMKDIVEDYFGIYRYTGPLHACEEIYMPFNHGENHWLCLNINMEKWVAYLFDSSRCIDTDEDRKNQATLLVQSLHKLLQYAHGEDYVQDVSSFAFQWLEDMPRQDNSYDCGLFVIKYMQGKPLPSGVIKARLLLDLVIYKHNSADIVADIVQYKAELRAKGELKWK
ncbi:unnamed protein product [Camellia sinensis]